MIIMTFIAIFTQLCNEIGKAPSTVCKELGLSNSAYTVWKNRNAEPRGTTLQRIADYFNVSIEYLTGESTERTTKRTKEPSGGNSISISLSDLEFALFRGIQSLSDFEKQDLLDYLQFKKEQKERRNNQN